MKGFFYCFLLLAVVALSTPVSFSRDFEFQVRHHHTFRDCRGALKITADGIEYQTAHKEDSRRWRFEEIRTLKVESPTKISLVTYEDQKRFAGKDRVFEFTLIEGRVTPELSAFLLEQVRRPMQIAVIPEASKPAFEMPVKHLETFGGARGMLRIYPDRVVFEASRERDSRIWRLKDIQRFGQPDRFRFQIVGYVPKAGGPTEVYNFELLEDLPEGLYDYLWVRLHPSTYYPETQPE